MPQRRPRRSSHSESAVEYSSSKLKREPARPPRERLGREWTEALPSQARSTHPNLTSLIECDAPLQAHSGLVLLYGPFQAEMVPQEGQGVASWLRECVRKHGIPSLVRFDYRHRAQVFRRDQFQPWLEPLISNVSG